jgi:quercetin dioxygenase-like cupin family protein
MRQARGFWMGVTAGVAGTLLVGAAAATVGPAWAQAPTSGKATYKTLLENDHVRVREAVFPAGVLDTGMHTHEYAHVGVILTKGSLVFTEPGGKPETVSFDAGSVGYREAKATHNVGNPGTSPMKVIEVELKK